jgi:hypothetical protein
MIKYEPVEPGTVRGLIKALESFVAEHGDMPVLFEDEAGRQSPLGHIGIYDAAEDQGMDDDEAPFLRAVISA